MASHDSFKIDVADSKLAEIRERVAAYRWFPAPENTITGWES